MKVTRPEKETEIFPPESLKFFAQQYLEWMGVMNGAEATIKARGIYLKLFFVWCEERSVTDLVQVTPTLLERYQKYLYHYRKQDGEPLSFNSQSYRITHVKEFFRWCAKKRYLTYNPASEIELPKTGKRLPKFILSVSEVEQVLMTVDLEDPYGLRDRAILETLYSTGIRRMELVNLKLYDVDRSRGTIAVRQGKGKKDRVIPIGERATVWIDRYIEMSRPHFIVEPDPGNVFLGRFGQPMAKDHLSVVVREIIERSGIGKTGSCHLFRHTMATLMLESGTDIKFIKEMLGHARLDTTEIYTHVSIRKLKEIHTALHPGATFKKRTSDEP